MSNLITTTRTQLAASLPPRPPGLDHHNWSPSPPIRAALCHCYANHTDKMYKDVRASYVEQDVNRLAATPVQKSVSSSILDLDGTLLNTSGIDGTLPIKPWHIGGPVIEGFGRGSKVLGIPTANLPTEDYSDLLSEHPSGVYFGWAGVSKRGIYKMVMSIGYNPYFNNPKKTIEPWLLHEFEDEFYGEELRLVVVGYIRPQADFPSLESLVAKIHEDRRIAESALQLPVYSKYKDDPFLKSMLETTSSSHP